MTLVSRDRTIQEMCSELEAISKECRSQTLGRNRDEIELLRAIADAADKARERLIDTKIAMLRYVTFSLNHDEFELEDDR